MLFFCLFQYFEEKEYQTKSKRNETLGSVTFGTKVIQRTWSASQEAVEVATRLEAAPTPTGRAPLSCGPLGRPPTYFFLLYIPTYPENIGGDDGNLIPPPQPSISARSHLGAFVGAPPEGEWATEGLYIISKGSPMCGE